MQTILGYIGIGIGLTIMMLSFGFCRICNKWESKCTCHKINPEQDAKN